LENFSVFESQPQAGAEAGAYKSSNIFLEKSSSFVVNSHKYIAKHPAEGREMVKDTIYTKKSTPLEMELV